MRLRAQVLINVDELMRLLAGAEPPAILDVRWRLDQPDGSAAYQAGHIPGAVYVSLDDDLSDHAYPHGFLCLDESAGHEYLHRPPEPRCDL